MTEEQKAKIVKFRAEGLRYADIADKLHISINTVKSFYRRCDKSTVIYCKNCGKSINKPNGVRMKKFCSDKCRMEWWKLHNDEMKKNAVYNFKCQSCGNSFQAYGNNHRKYCSRECYIKTRFGG